MKSRTPASSSTRRFRDVLVGRALTERALDNHLGHRSAETLQAGGLARLAEVVVLAGVADLDGEPAGQAAEELVGMGDELATAQSEVGAVGAVGHDGDPGAPGAQDRAVPFLERPPAPPAGDGTVERDEVAVPERGLGGGPVMRHHDAVPRRHLPEWRPVGSPALS